MSDASATQKATVGGLERLYTMSHVDRKCACCGWPLMALEDGGLPCGWPEDRALSRSNDCPKCGRPTRPEDNISREEARALRTERGLIP